MKISENTSIAMPMRNLISIIGACIVGAWFGFGVIERLNIIETELQLMQQDLLEASTQKPIDQEQFMLLEFVSEQVEDISDDLEDMSHNKVNITRLQTDMEKALKDIEALKDKVRNNGN